VVTNKIAKTDSDKGYSPPPPPPKKNPVPAPQQPPHHLQRRSKFPTAFSSSSCGEQRRTESVVALKECGYSLRFVGEFPAREEMGIHHGV